MVKLRINPMVAVDLKHIERFIAEDDPEMALKTIQEIYSQFENIQHLPGLGAAVVVVAALRLAAACTHTMIIKSNKRLKLQPR